MKRSHIQRSFKFKALFWKASLWRKSCSFTYLQRTTVAWNMLTDVVCLSVSGKHENIKTVKKKNKTLAHSNSLEDFWNKTLKLSLISTNSICKIFDFSIFPGKFFNACKVTKLRSNFNKRKKVTHLIKDLYRYFLVILQIIEKVVSNQTKELSWTAKYYIAISMDLDQIPD